MSTTSNVFQANFKRVTDGQSVTAIAAQTGIDPGSVSRYLAGKREPSLALLRLIAQTYAVSTDALLGLDKEAA